MVGQKVLLTDKTGHAPPFRCLDVDRLDVTDPGQFVYVYYRGAENVKKSKTELHFRNHFTNPG